MRFSLLFCDIEKNIQCLYSSNLLLFDPSLPILSLFELRTQINLCKYTGKEAIEKLKYKSIVQSLKLSFSFLRVLRENDDGVFDNLDLDDDMLAQLNSFAF